MYFFCWLQRAVWPAVPLKPDSLQYCKHAGVSVRVSTSAQRRWQWWGHYTNFAAKARQQGRSPNADRRHPSYFVWSVQFQDQLTSRLRREHPHSSQLRDSFHPEKSSARGIESRWVSFEWQDSGHDTTIHRKLDLADHSQYAGGALEKQGSCQAYFSGSLKTWWNYFWILRRLARI